MILARLRRVRRVSALVGLLCTLIVVLGARDASVAGERRVHEEVARTGDMMSVARSARVEVARPLGAHDRSVPRFLLVPHDALAVLPCDVRRRPMTLPSVETLVARPRRLTFRYEATAPPSAL